MKKVFAVTMASLAMVFTACNIGNKEPIHLRVLHTSDVHGRVLDSLQRINTYVFQDPVGLMRNIELLTSFMREKEKDPPADGRRGGLPALHQPRQRRLFSGAADRGMESAYIGMNHLSEEAIICPEH